MNLSCPTCSQLLQVPSNAAGKKVSCPKCGQRILLPPQALAMPGAANKTVLGKIEESIGTQFPESPAHPIGSPGFGVDASRSLTYLSWGSLIVQILRSSPLGIGSLAFGCIALIVSIIPYITLVCILLSSVGLILGITGLIICAQRNQSRVGFPIAGTGLNVVSLSIGLIIFATAGGSSVSNDSRKTAQNAKVTSLKN